jgi:hypothetical protein
MSTSSAKLTGGAMVIAKYLTEEETSGIMGGATGAAQYYAGESGQQPGKRGFGPNDVVFRQHQIHGAGLEAMGLERSMDLTMAMFSNLMEGRNATTGEQLTKAGHRIVYETDATGRPVLDDEGNRIRKLDPETGKPVKAEARHTAGIDVFFSAPKCVSILNAVAARENSALQASLLAAHDHAVAEALQWVEQTVPLGRRTVSTPTEAGERVVTKGPRKGQPSKTQGSRSERVPVQLVIVSARQHTARPTEATMSRGAPPDMSLHSHNVILGVGYDAVADKYVTVDDYGLKTSAVERDARYMAALARNLEDAGIEIEYGSFDDFENSKNGRVPWRVKGITDEAIAHYSSNRQRAWDLAKDYEQSTGKAATPAVLRERMRGTRRTKDPLAKQMDSRPIYELWEQDAERCGITMATPELRQRLREEPQPVERAPLQVRLDELWRRLDSANGFTREAATFDAQSATTSLARCAEGLGLTDDELMQAELTMWERLIKDPNSPEKRPRYTTPKQLADERSIDASLHAKVATTYPAPARESIHRAIGRQTVSLDEEQWAAIEQACSGRGITVWEGYAGTGKTTALKAVVAAHRESGQITNVVMVSTAALTAKESGRKIGADYAGSVESVSKAVQHGRLKIDRHSLVIFDESAMCDTRRQVVFQKLTKDARVIYVGDPEQAQAIGAAGWYADATTWLPKAVLTNVHRQKDHRDVVDLAKLRDGESIDVVANLSARGRFHVAKDHQERLSMAQEAYVTHREAGRSATDVRIILDASNTDVDTANRRVQSYRLDKGEIGRHGFEVEATEEARRWTLHKGDSVLFLQPYGSGKQRIANGTSGEIRQIHPRTGKTLVDLGDGKLAMVQLEASADRQPLGLAYAVHTQKFQGGEVPVVLAVPGSAGITNKNTAYSTLSRCIDEVHVYADHETHGESPETTLASAWSRSPAQVSARRLIGEAMEPERPNTERAAHQSPDIREAVSAERHMKRLERVVGTEMADQVRAAPAYPTLAKHLTDLDRSGANTTAMLRTVAKARPLTTADDPAAVLVYRLERTQRIERGEAPEGPGQGLITPRAAQQPTPRDERFTQLDEIRATAHQSRLQETLEWQQQREAQRIERQQDQGRGLDLGL